MSKPYCCLRFQREVKYIYKRKCLCPMTTFVYKYISVPIIVVPQNENKCFKTKKKEQHLILFIRLSNKIIPSSLTTGGEKKHMQNCLTNPIYLFHTFLNRKSNNFHITGFLR